MMSLPIRSAALMRRLDTLNGWERLWCIAVLIWLLACIAVTWHYFPAPTEDEMLYIAINGAVEMYRAEGESIGKTQSECSRKEVSEGVDAASECYQYLWHLKANHDAHVDRAVENIRADLQAKILPLQIWTIEKAIVLLVGPSIGLYLLGWGISWARRGFQR